MRASLPLRRIFIAVALTAAVVALPLGVVALVAPPATPDSPTGQFAQGTVLPNGRLVTPAGRVVDVGDFPLGVAVSPDGRLAVSVNSGYGFGLNTGFNSYCQQGQGAGTSYCPYIPAAQAARQIGDPREPAYDNSLSVVDLRSGRRTGVVAAPTVRDPARSGSQGTFNYFYVGATFSPDGRHLYAAGGGNGAVYDFPVHKAMIGPRPLKTVILPSLFCSNPNLPQGAGSVGCPSFPVAGTVAGFTKGMAVTPNGRCLLVAHEFNNTLDIVDTRTYSYTLVPLSEPAPTGGSYPYAVAVSHDGLFAYVTEQGTGTVAVVALTGCTGAVVDHIGVGDHPTGIAISPDNTQLYVANADDDTLSIISRTVATTVATLTLHALLPATEGLGSTPNAVAVSPDGGRIYVALAGDNAVAVVGAAAGAAGSNGAPAASPPPAALSVLGYIPTGWYVSGVATNADGSAVYAVSAKGLGSRYPDQNRSGAITSTYEYDGDNMPGVLQIVKRPDAAALAAGTSQVAGNIAFATGGVTRSAHNPIPLEIGGPSPITHVIEIVRENRTFDQVLGDLGTDEGRAPQQVDADPSLTLFGRDTTPNAHAFAGDPITGTTDPAFAIADNFYSDGEASIQGHWWTAAANVNDYVEKSWRHYYSPRGHVYDPISSVSQPRNCTIFQSALLRQASAPGFTYRNYGELIGLVNPSIPGVFSSQPGVANPCSALVNLALDPQAANDESLDQDNRANAREFLSDIGLDEQGTQTISGTLGLNYLRNFSYITLSGDHTGGLAFANTPRSRVAQNDAAVGLIAQAISHSKYYSSTAIFVMEDDSQDGLDHRDGHRNLLYVISPYVKHVGADGKPGYVGHRHYSQASVLKTIDLLMGFPYLSTYDQNAPALYDLFQDKDTAAQLTQDDRQPFTLQPAPSFIDETSDQYRKASAAAGASLTALSRKLNLTALDRAGPELEVIDWRLAHPGRPLPLPLLRAERRWQLYTAMGGLRDEDK